MNKTFLLNNDGTALKCAGEIKKIFFNPLSVYDKGLLL